MRRTTKQQQKIKLKSLVNFSMTCVTHKEEITIQVLLRLNYSLCAVHSTLSTNNRDRPEPHSLETSQLAGVCLGQVIRKQCSI